ncbi:hypothetical protein ACFO3J_32650 [Streptomyces polygonati]|uniref:Uncharacterized protein n=1 Tax=Streptomyces polygonati TaxID=1617087 RepID=A0ABV8HVR9_9ACTN
MSGPRAPARSTAPASDGPVTARAAHGRCSVRARFSLSELPVVVVYPPQATWAGAAAARALAVAGRSYLGGRLQLRTYGAGPYPARLVRAVAAAQRRAATLAVESTLRGGRGTARVRVRCRS